MTYFKRFYDTAAATAAGQVIDLPRDMWQVLPERRPQPAPGLFALFATVALIATTSILWAIVG